MTPRQLPSFVFLLLAVLGISDSFGQQQSTPSASPLPVVTQADGRNANQSQEAAKGEADRKNQSEAGLKPVTLQLAWLHQFQFAGYYAAVEQGFYRDAGFDVTIIEGASDRRPIEEVVSGRANYGVARSELLLSRLHGEPVVALAAIFQHSAIIMLAKQESGINSPQDMIGKRVMLLSGDDAAEYLAMFKSEGVSLDKVRIIPATYNIDDLIVGKTDVFNAYITNEPHTLAQKGIPASIISPITYGIDFYGDCLFTSEQEIHTRPDQVKAFRAASLRGWEYAMAHPEEMIDVIVGKYGVKKSREHLRFEAEAMRKLMLPDLVEIGLMNPGRWHHMAETYVALGMAEARYSLQGFMYDPDPTPDYSWVPRVLGIGTVIVLLTSSAFFILLRFNTKLQSEVAQRRQAEEKLSRARNELERRVGERTAELTTANEQLNIENSERKQAEEALRVSEQKVRRKLEAILSPEADIGAFELSDIIDSDQLQKLMDAFYRLTRIGIGIVDLNGRVLVGTGWQDICTKFHRVNPESRLLCIESDLELSRNAPPGAFKQYRCKNNLWDMATPIMLGDRQVGNIFLGQFLLADENPDYETFKLQADRYGFNREEYLAALDRVPRWSRETVDAAMSFYAIFAVIIGNLSYSTIKLASALEERKRSKVALQRLNRELRAISDCNQVLVRVENEQALLDEICRIICDEAGYRMAWVGYVENDQKKGVCPVAWAGVEDGYLTNADISRADTEYGHGPIGKAISSGETICIQDFAGDPQAALWRANALQRGYRSSIALPLKDELKNVFGVLNIYATEPNAFTPDETRLMEELAGDLAFGIQALRNRIGRKESEQRIALLSFALNSVHEAAFLIDEQGRFHYVNEESCRMLGYGRDELLTLGVAEVDSDFPMERWPEHWAELKSRQSLTFEGRHKTKDGHLFPVEINANYLEYDGQGYNLAMVRDSSKRKQAEEGLHKLNEELEQRVRQRTAELEKKNAELQKTKKLFVGRELRMVELKERVKELERLL
jgi:PAS domain S-box-containing protein